MATEVIKYKQKNKCTGCGRCAQVCVMGAISMTSFVEMAARRFRKKKPEIQGEEII